MAKNTGKVAQHNYYRNTNQNYNEVSPHSIQNSHNQNNK